MTALAAICVLAAVLPFELRAPVATLGPILLTNVEMVLYLALAIALPSGWLGHASHQRPSRPILLAALIWTGVMVVSALLAPVYRDLALKFALRTLSGSLLCVAVAGVVRTPAQRLAVIGALAAGAVVSATAGVLEVWVPVWRGMLMPFKEQLSLAGGANRASGTFDYANTAAMYWEAVLPVTVAAAAWLWLGGRNRLLAATAFGASLVLALGVALSLSRAGVFTAAAGLIALAVIGHRTAKPLRNLAGAALACLLICVLAAPGAAGFMLLRFRSVGLEDWYRPEYQVEPAATTVEAGQEVPFAVTVRNRGLVAWPAEGDDRIALSWFWEQRQPGPGRSFSGARAVLPQDIPPGSEATISAVVRAPSEPGDYRLHWDLVLEDVTWFSGLGAPTGQTDVTVTAATVAVAPAPVSMDEIVPPAPRIRRRELWTTALALWREHPILGVGPDNFRRLQRDRALNARGDDRTHANSLYVETLVNLGVVGVLALAGLIGAVAWEIRRTWTRDSTARVRVLTAGVGVAAGAFFLHGVLDYFLIFTPTYGLFWLLLGVIAGSASRPDGR